MAVLLDCTPSAFVTVRCNTYAPHTQTDKQPDVQAVQPRQAYTCSFVVSARLCPESILSGSEGPLKTLPIGSSN